MEAASFQYGGSLGPNDDIIRLGAIGEIPPQQLRLVDLDHEVGGDLEPRRGALGREIGRRTAAELGDADVLRPALDVVDPRDAVGIARDQQRDVVGLLERDHVDGQAGVEPLLVDGMMEQVDLPVPFLADLDKVGRGLDAVVEPLLPLEGSPLALVPLAGLAEAEVPGLFDPALERHVGNPSAGVFDVGVAEPGVHLEPRPQPRLGLGIVQVPLIHLADDVPVDSRMLGGRPPGPFGERPAPVMHALLEHMTIKRAIIVHAQVEMLQDAIKIGSVNKSHETKHH